MAQKKTRGASGGRSTSRLDVDLLRRVVDIVEASEVTQLVWENGDEKILIRRGPQEHAVAAAPAPVRVPPPMLAPRPSAPQAVAAAAATPAPEKKGFIVTSPFVGTFYRTPAPDQPPYVDIGTMVKKGQVLCIVEAMKLMNEIESEVAGRVAEVLTQNAQPVEFGQPLFRIEPA